MKKERFNVEGMTCAACQAHVTKATQNVKGVKSVSVNLLKNNMDVEYDENICSLKDIDQELQKQGYRAYSGKKEEIKEKTKDNSLKELIISIVILLILMYVSMGNMMWGFPLPDFIDMHHNKMGFALIQFILVLPIIYIYRRYYISGFKKLIHKSPNMDTLISIGSLASLIYGIISLFIISYGYYLGNDYGKHLIEEYHMNLYFESAGMILVLVSVGKYLEGLSKKKTTKAIEELMDLAPKKAVVLVDGKEEEIGIEEVRVDDILVIRRGEAIPVDGIVVEGNCSINEANITGEAIPKYKNIGDFCYSSTIIESGFIKLKATKVGEDSSINTIIKLVDEASNSKAPISKLADKISAIFVPLIMIISLITFITNIIVASNLGYDNSFELALNFAITVIVIACPCALGLATPVAVMVGTGKGASNGLLIRNAEILENTSKLKTIVFDKTGTITLGKPIVTDYIKLKEIDFDDILYSIEAKSSHPLAKSIINYLNKENSLDIGDVKVIEGEGLVAKYNNKIYYVGNYKGLANRGLENAEIKEKIDKLSGEGKTSILILEDNVILGIIALKDVVKTNSKKAIEELHKLKIKTIMLTGDNKLVADSIAKEVGIDEVIADVLPIDKGNAIKKLKEESEFVGFVGDGVNDAIALANSDIAISLGNASDIAINTADIVLLHDDLLDIPNVIKLSKRTLNTIKLGLFWAFFYNFICVIIATGFMYYINGFKMVPMYGAIAMSISSVCVVLNALTINLFKCDKIKEDNLITLKVKGMMCEKCVKHVEDACLIDENVIYAKASLKNKNVVIKYEKEINLEKIINKITEEGYKVRR